MSFRIFLISTFAKVVLHPLSMDRLAEWPQNYRSWNSNSFSCFVCLFVCLFVCFVLFCFVLLWFGLVCFGLVWFGWFVGLVWFGLGWFGLVWFGCLFCFVWFGFVWFVWSALFAWFVLHILLNHNAVSWLEFFPGAGMLPDSLGRKHSQFSGAGNYAVSIF